VLGPDAHHYTFNKMPFPKLTVLQSRLAASVVATALVLLLYFALSSTHFAYASEVDSILPEDHNHERLLGPYILEGEADGEDNEIVGYQPDFLGVDRGIIGRADPGTDAVNNNMPVNMNIELGTTKLFVFTNASLWGEMAGPTEGLPSAGLVRREKADDKDDEEAETTTHISHYEDGGEGLRLRRRADTRKVYITLNTCLQPAAVNDQARGMPPPQLTLYVSQNNTHPGPDQPANSYTKVIADHGFANLTLDASKDVYIGVTAPNTTSYSGVYNVEVAASIDAPYHSLSTQNGPDLFFIDSDSSSALLVTADLADEINGTIADKWMSLDPPYVIFANNQNDSAFSGIQNSYCGLEKIAQIAGTQGGVRTNMVQTSMTNRTTSSFPKQQFYFRGLNASSEYFGILAMSGNSTAHGSGVVGGGGRVWPTMTFTTQPGMYFIYHPSASRN
jgi:calcium channel MID1